MEGGAVAQIATTEQRGAPAGRATTGEAVGVTGQTSVRFEHQVDVTVPRDLGSIQWLLDGLQQALDRALRDGATVGSIYIRAEMHGPTTTVQAAAGGAADAKT